jgi:DNA processing protein
MCIYPPAHLELSESILADGAAVSEMPLRWEPRAHDFPRRNRLISGLSIGVIVVEAARRSGSLITARLAGEQGREVFAVPGSPLDPRCQGTNELLKQGATPVTDASDVIAAVGPIMGTQSEPATIDEPSQDRLHFSNVQPNADERSRIVELLGPAPVSIDDLIRLAQATPTIVRTALLELEIAGRIEHHGAGFVSLL